MMNETIPTNKKNTVLGVIIIILLLILIGLVSLLLLKNDDTKENNETENNSQEITNPVPTPDTEKEEGFDLSKFDGTKCLNATSKESVYTLEQDNDESKIGLSVSLNSDKKSATITIEWSKYFEVYGISATTGEVREYPVSNFSKKINSVYLSGFGQASGYESVFYIMEDGTVEYTPISKALGNNGSSSSTVLKSFGTIPDVNKVVQLKAASESAPQLAGSGISIIGIKEDGSFYDLSSILYKTGNY